MRRIAALLGKEIDDLRGNPGVFFPAVLTGLISLLMPFVIAVAVPYFSGERLADSSDFRGALQMYRDQPALQSLDAEGAIQAVILQQFLIMLVLTPVAGAMAIAASAVVGEKQARTLEPLLATPLTTFELLSAKVLGALLPGIALMAVFVGAYVIGAALLAQPGVYRALLTPRALSIVLVLSPLASLAALQLAVCVSSRVNDARSAQQIGALIILPISALLVAEFTGNLQLTTGVTLVISAALAVLNAVLMVVGVRLFDRESILTRWK